jgi:hypothetical protein
MERIVTGIMISLCFVIRCTDISAQHLWQPAFKQPLGSMAAAGKMLSLSEFLTRDVGFDSGNNSCEPQFAIFYFRVNYQGEIDSLYVEGDITAQGKDQIFSNLRSTQKQWSIPKITTSKDKCWFLFPFYNGGNGKRCSEQQDKHRKQMLRVNQLYSFSESTMDRWGRVILPANQFYPPSIK